MFCTSYKIKLSLKLIPRFFSIILGQFNKAVVSVPLKSTPTFCQGCYFKSRFTPALGASLGLSSHLHVGTYKESHLLCTSVCSLGISHLPARA